MSSPYSTGGGGTQLETRVAASCLVAALCEAPVRGLPGDFATAAQSQRAAFDHPLDDIIVKGIRADGREVRLDLQVTDKLIFTANDAKWVDVLQRSWDTFVKPGFDVALHRIGVGIGVYNARVDQHYQSVLTWAGYSTNGRDFRERIEKRDFSHKDRQAFVETVRTVLKSCGDTRFPVSSCSFTIRSTASMLSRSRFFCRSASGVIDSRGTANAATR